MRLYAAATPRNISILTEVAKAAVSGVTFLLMASLLGPESYGTYVLFAAIAVILVPLGTAGYSYWVQPLVLQRGAPAATSVIYPIALLVGIPSTLAAIYIVNLIFPGQLLTITFVVLIEMLVFPLWSAVVMVFLTSGALSHYLVASVAVPVIKLLGTVAALIIFQGNLATWGMILLLLGIGGIGVTAYVARCRSFSYGFKTMLKWLRRGYGFALVGIASGASDSVDKLVVGYAGGPANAGAYGVSSRFATYGVIPVRAIALVSYPEYFQLAEARRYPELRHLMYSTIRKSFWLGMASALLVIMALVVASSSILIEYRDSVPIGAVLAGLIPLRGVQYAAGDVTYALGKPQWRLGITVLAGFITAAFVVVGYQQWGSLGAAVGAALATIFAAITLLAYVETSIRKLSQEQGDEEDALLHYHRQRQRIG